MPPTLLPNKQSPNNLSYWQIWTIKWKKIKSHALSATCPTQTNSPAWFQKTFLLQYLNLSCPLSYEIHSFTGLQPAYSNSHSSQKSCIVQGHLASMVSKRGGCIAALLSSKSFSGSLVAISSTSLPKTWAPLAIWTDSEMSCSVPYSFMWVDNPRCLLLMIVCLKARGEHCYPCEPMSASK